MQEMSKSHILSLSYPEFGGPHFFGYSGSFFESSGLLKSCYLTIYTFFSYFRISPTSFYGFRFFLSTYRILCGKFTCNTDFLTSFFRQSSAYAMQYTMVTYRHYLKIFYSVIKSIAIYMVNKFSAIKFTPKKLFHKVSVFSNIPSSFTLNEDIDVVPVIINPFGIFFFSHDLI